MASAGSISGWQKAGHRVPPVPRHGHGRRHAGPRRSAGLAPLPGLVVAGGLPGDDVQPVVRVDDGDQARQRAELIVVVVLGRARPGVVGHAAGRVGDPGALLGEFQGGPLGLGEHRGLPPGRDQVEPELAFPGGQRVLGVHVGAHAAAVDLAGPQLHQFLRGRWQGRVGQDRARRVEVLGELRRDGVIEVAEPGFHRDLLAVAVVTPP